MTIWNFYENIKKLLGNACFLTILVCLLVESQVHSPLLHRYISHEVDWTVRNILYNPYNSPVVVVGDSVGRGVFQNWFKRPEEIAVLACNQATESAGQYFFYKRYLEVNPKPGAVVVCDTQPFSGNLEQKLTENYVQRVFTSWKEIYTLLVVKRDLVFSVKMISYKLFSSLKYRLQIQKALTGFTNAEIITGTKKMETKDRATNFGLFDIIKKFLMQFRSETISTLFVKRMAAELEEDGISLYYLPPPTTPKKAGLVQKSIRKFETLRKDHKNVFILKSFSINYPEEYFSDGVHLNQEGLVKFNAMISKKLVLIIQEAKANLRKSK